MFATLVLQTCVIVAALAGGVKVGATTAARSAWSLAAAGYPQLVIRPGAAAQASRSVTLNLPPHAVQGAGTWYRIRLHYRLELDPQTPPGHVYVEAASDSYPCAMIRFDVTRKGGEPHVVKAETGVVNGSNLANVGLVYEGRFENVLEYRGVRGGPNAVTFTIERLGAARARKLTIFPDTAIVSSRAGLPALTLEPFVPRHLKAGRPFVLRFHVQNTGGISTQGGHVALLPGSGLRQLAPAPFPALRPGGSAAGSLRLVAPKPGRYRLTLAATTSTAGRAATLAVTIS